MNQNEPPFIATWLLDHFVPGGLDEGLAGDLCEEYRAGRSTGWYWRQVNSAIAIGMYRAKFGRAALFALLWSLLAPSWLLMVATAENNADLSTRFYRMDWPWSTVCDLGLLLLADLAFIWIGIILYQVPEFFRPKGRAVRQMSRGVAASIPVLIVISAALIVIPKYFIDLQTYGRTSLNPVNLYAITNPSSSGVRQLTPQHGRGAQSEDPVTRPVVDLASAITDVHGSTVLVRVPFFLVVLCALWRVSRLNRNEREQISI